MKIFVTGATGFIGRNFVRHALDLGHEVVALGRTWPEEASFGKSREREQRIQGGLTSLKAHHFSGCSALVHLAAHGVNPQKSNWADCFRVNVLESLEAWTLAADEGVKRFVICGSCFEYGASGQKFDRIPTDAPLMPTGPYHSSKAAATMAAIGLAHHRKLECIIARPFHVFGEGEADYRFWPSLRTAALSGQNFPMTAGEQIRDFVPVELVAKKFLEACSLKKVKSGTATVLNIGTGKAQTLRQFAEYWWEQWNAKGRLHFGEIPYRENEVMRYVPKIDC
ncbi:MAG: NAD-dependent epimerase/dehydratase family protein [Opitutales bacterium]